MNKLVGFTYNKDNKASNYIYRRNIQGDIIGIYDSLGNEVGWYAYDAYGKCYVKYKNNSSEEEKTILNANPFRYRGYYYDNETGLYYLNARYYDPSIGRFISPDVLTILDETKGQINGLNLYMYCNNNPIMYIDPSGNLPQWAMWLIGGIILASSIILTIATGGAAAGTILATIHTIAAGSMLGGITSAAIGTIAGGLTYDNGIVSWSWDGAAEGFMWGAITGAVSGAAGAALSNIGSSLVAYGKIGKIAYASIQGLINSGISGGLSALQGLVTGGFTWDSVGVSAIFGFAGGAIGITKLGEGIRNILVSFGLNLGESSIGEIIEFLQSNRQSNKGYLKFSY